MKLMAAQRSTKLCFLILLLLAPLFCCQIHAAGLPPGGGGPSYAHALAACEEYIANYWFEAYGHYGTFGAPSCVDVPDRSLFEIQSLNESNGTLFHFAAWNYNSSYGAPDPGRNGGPPCDCAGDPINLTSGQEYRDEWDGGQGVLAFRRFYTSDPAMAYGQLGPGWRMSFDASLTVKEDGTNGVAFAYRPNGMTLTFYKSSGVWVSAPDVHETLVGLGDAGARSGWRLFDPETRANEHYDAMGKLTSIVDADGLVTSFSYSTTTTPASLAPSAGLLLSVVDPRGRKLNLAYASSGRLGTLTHPDGTTVGYTYDEKGNLSRVTYADGTYREYRYNEPGLNDSSQAALTGIIDENGTRLVTIGYESQTIGNGWQMLATSSSLAGGADATKVSYATGSTTVTYPTGAQVLLQTATTFGKTHTVSASSPCGIACGQPNQSATYDANGHVSSTTDFNGHATIFAHDTDGLLTQSVEASGTPDQRTIDTTWDKALRVPLVRTVKDASGALVRKEGWAYNSRGQATAQCLIDPLKAPSYTCVASGTAPVGVRRMTSTYCESVSTTCPLLGLLLKVDGPRSDVGDTLTYAWYQQTDESACAITGGACHHAGDLKTVTDGAGLVTTFVSYDKAGRPTRIKAPNGVLTDYEYTPRGWLATTTVRAQASGAPSTNDAVTTVTYNPDGTVHQVTDPDKVTMTYTYDAAHRLTDVTDGQGRRYHYTLDAAGNRTKEQVITAAGIVERTTSQSFNTLGQLTAITDGLNRTVFSATFADSFDANGNLVHSQDGLGIQRKQVFDGLNRLVSTLRNYQGADTATKDVQSVTSFDALDRVTGFSDPDGLNTTYDIDALGNATGQHSPDTGTTTRAFDAAGNVTTSTDATNNTSTSTYDANNRILSTSYADTSLNVQYKYDEADSVTGCTGSFGKGHLTRIVEGDGGIVFCYDARGNVVRKQQTVGTTTTTTAYTWTSGNRLNSVTTPNGTLIGYTRDSIGNVTAVTATPQGGTATTIVSDVVYRSFGPVASYKLGDGQTVTITHDASGALTDIVSTAFSLHVKRDALGNITSIGNANGVPTATETYGYDPLYRLSSVQNTAGTAIEAYTYNKTGDRLSKTGPGILTGAYSYAAGTHHLVGIGTTTRQVDSRGNTTASIMASGAYTFDYNQRNRLASVQKDGATVGSYVLNALGQRVQKVAGTTTTRFDYNEAGQLLSESTGTTSRDYVWLGDFPVGIVDRTETTSSVAFVHADGLGAPRAVTSATGAVLWQWPYASNPFGEMPPTSVTGYVLNLRFPGQYFDAGTGLSYNVNRDYEAVTGRYVQSDPLGLEAGPSTYAYTWSDPLNLTDRLGLACDEEDKCEQQVKADEAVCRTLSSANARALCWASANDRYGACVANRPIPPLVTYRKPVSDEAQAPGSQPPRPPLVPAVPVDPVVPTLPELPIFEPMPLPIP